MYRFRDLRFPAILGIIQRAPRAISLAEIEAQLPRKPPRRTLQYWLRSLVHIGRIRPQGAARSRRYVFVHGFANIGILTPNAAPNPPAATRPLPAQNSAGPGAMSAPIAANNPASTRAIPAISTPPNAIPAARPVQPPAAEYPAPPRAATTRAPTPSAAPDETAPSPRQPRPPARDAKLDARILARLYFVLPKVIRQMIPFSGCPGFFEDSAGSEFSTKELGRFVELAMSELAALNDSTRKTYSIQPTELSFWQERCRQR